MDESVQVMSSDPPASSRPLSEKQATPPNIPAESLARIEVSPLGVVTDIVVEIEEENR